MNVARATLRVPLAPRTKTLLTTIEARRPFANFRTYAPVSIGTGPSDGLMSPPQFTRVPCASRFQSDPSTWATTRSSSSRSSAFLMLLFKFDLGLRDVDGRIPQLQERTP